MDTKPAILVTGANGQLGSEFRRLSSKWPQFQFYFTDRNELPVDDEPRVKDFFAKHSIDYCINCAAYTAVDKAESEKETAMRVNAVAPSYLAETCLEHRSKFIHISTDYVFDGRADSPYTEKNATNPESIYGESKRIGEKSVLNTNPNSIIIRSSWVYSEFGKNFVKTMLRLFQEKDEISVVNDQIGSPTYAADMAAAILSIINSEKWAPGIYHYCNEGIISWYDFAIAIRDLSHSSCDIKPITTEQYPTAAKRPAYSALSTEKIRNTFSIVIPGWRDSLAVCIERLSEV